MNQDEFIISSLKESAETKIKTADLCRADLKRALQMLIASVNNRGKIMFCGNGGSAADAQHLAAELVIRLSHTFPRPGIAAIALTTDTSVITAGSNDLGFANVFARQVEAIGHPEDVLIVLSTSGNSENITAALNAAAEKNIRSIGFLGGDGGAAKDLVTVPVIVPSESVQRIQETHITLGHILIEMLEKDLFEKND